MKRRPLAYAELHDLMQTLEQEDKSLIQGWLLRGDGVAVYRNVDLTHPEIGHVLFVSYGSKQAMIGRRKPPKKMPDVAEYSPHWRYRLYGVYREAA